MAATIIINFRTNLKMKEMKRGSNASELAKKEEDDLDDVAGDPVKDDESVIEDTNDALHKFGMKADVEVKKHDNNDESINDINTIKEGRPT